MTILFSPIGGTDPISFFHDGAMLHICRKYLPDKVYLYLSGEMCEEHDRNDPYCYCLRRLAEHTGHSFDSEIIRREELTEVQVFDSFVKDFQEILKKIQEKEDADQILVNVSSGTPAMKSSLLMLSILSEGKYLPIQVATPEKKMNPRGEDWGKLDIVERWDVNLDNDSEYEDRTSIASSQNWVAEIKKEVIQRHIRAYNYVAALEVTDSMPLFNQECRKLIQAAVCRLRLDFKGMEKRINNTEYSSFFVPVREGNNRTLVEYALGLKIRLKKEEYSDFLRALSPILYDLYKLVLKEDCGIDIDKKYTVPWKSSDRKELYQNCRIDNEKNKSLSEKTSSRRWSSEKLLDAPEILKVFETKYGIGKFRYSRVENDHLYTLISGLTKDSFIRNKIDILNCVEKEQRHIAAHQMVSVTKYTIREAVGMWPEDIMKTLQQVLDRYIINNRDNVWNSYDLMNEAIIKALNG